MRKATATLCLMAVALPTAGCAGSSSSATASNDYSDIHPQVVGSLHPATGGPMPSGPTASDPNQQPCPVNTGVVKPYVGRCRLRIEAGQTAKVDLAPDYLPWRFAIASGDAATVDAGTTYPSGEVVFNVTGHKAGTAQIVAISDVPAGRGAPNAAIYITVQVI